MNEISAGAASSSAVSTSQPVRSHDAFTATIASTDKAVVTQVTSLNPRDKNLALALPGYSYGAFLAMFASRAIAQAGRVERRNQKAGKVKPQKTPKGSVKTKSASETRQIEKALIPLSSDPIVDPRKLTEYALNMRHPEGKNKAVLFEKILGFNTRNWEDLSKAIKAGLSVSPAKLGGVRPIWPALHG